MAKSLKRYDKEEEFLDDLSEIASSASLVLGGDWEPNYWCNDKTRHKIQYFLSRGELQRLMFDSASVCAMQMGFPPHKLCSNLPADLLRYASGKQMVTQSQTRLLIGFPKKIRLQDWKLFRLHSILQGDRSPLGQSHPLHHLLLLTRYGVES